MGEADARVQSPELDKSALRDAATVIVLRDRDTAPKVLMGQRGSKAAFMPNKFVFPGGAVDADDHRIALHSPLRDICDTRLRQACEHPAPDAMVIAAIRELWEETGLILGQRGDWPAPVPADWVEFAERGYVPDPGGAYFIFRAITPKGRPRRFDARFFLVDADRIAGDLDDFSGAQDELSHLQWVPLDRAREFDLPFITEVVLGEVSQILSRGLPPQSVPFFDNSTDFSHFKRLV